MAQVTLVSPRLPTAPVEYDVVFMSDLLRALEVFIQQERNAGEERGTKLVLTEMPTSDSGLEAGTLYRIGNDVKISLTDMAVPDSLSATMSVGTVTVAVS